ncbi:MAG TPA: alpha/beta hydrolase [Acidimicrobiia bacterium]|nr:alpha/beta hydrolase [Acidimicrobiia bacterium]
MPEAVVNGNRVYYDIIGGGDPVMLIAGLSGVGRGWGEHVGRFGSGFTTIVPDHPGTGQSSPPIDGFSIEGHARDLAELIRSLECGPTHVVGSSTGGAVAMVMALDHPDVVRSICVVSSWARADDFFRHQFAVRRDVLVRNGSEAYARVSALFLFSPDYFRFHYDEVEAWCQRASSSVDPDVMTQRIDMILAHDQLDRVGGIEVPALVLVGREDGCTPLQFSEELAEAIPRSELAVLPGGHLIYKENPGDFYRSVRRFLVAQ